MSLVTLNDLKLGHVQLTGELRALRTAYFKAIPEICTERPRLITEYHLKHGLLDKDRITSREKARAYRHVLESWDPIVWHKEGHQVGDLDLLKIPDESPFAGTPTSKFKGVILYPEFLALTIWPELDTIATRESSPLYIAAEDREILNFQVFPWWLDNSLLELAKARRWSPDVAGHVPDFQFFQYLVFYLPTKPECISHTIPDFSRALCEGLRSLIIEAFQKSGEAGDSQVYEHYEAMAQGLEGIVALAANLSEKAEAMAREEPDPGRREKLEQIAEIYDRVPEAPARTFREGLTTIWICWLGILLEDANIGLSLGRLDQLLYPLYKADIEAGRLDPETAVHLVCHFWLRLGSQVPAVPQVGEELFGGSGSNQAITIGGVDEQGRDAVNDLTYVMLRATELMMLRDPNLNARYNMEQNSDEYLRRLCLSNLITRATPAIHNDLAAIEMLRARGMTEAQANDYAAVGCVEPCSNGRHYGHSGALLVNLPSVLELALFNGRHRHTGLDKPISPPTGDVADFTSYEQFEQAFLKQTKWMIDSVIAMNNALGQIHQQYYPTPILSALFEGPWESGKDLIQGGAVINSSGIAIIGIADVVDCLAAIQEVVYEEGSVSFEQLLDAINANFKGHEALQARLANPDKTPTFGNEDSATGQIMGRVVTYLSELAGKRENYRGGTYRVGYWTMTMHAGYGMISKAMPNGRKAGQNFASGITPVSDETPDLTRTLNSVASIPSDALANGVALNLKFTPIDWESNPQAEQEQLDLFCALIKGYVEGPPGPESGGLEIQFNITDRQAFIDEAKKPNVDPQLLVRVSGYTAYFKNLQPQMQMEIINRTEYDLKTGKARKYPPYHLDGSPDDQLWKGMGKEKRRAKRRERDV